MNFLHDVMTGTLLNMTSGLEEDIVLHQFITTSGGSRARGWRHLTESPSCPVPWYQPHHRTHETLRHPTHTHTYNLAKNHPTTDLNFRAWPGITRTHSTLLEQGLKIVE